MTTDDLGHPVDLAAPPRRVVGLVPSLTEALALSCPERVVGATRFCVLPPDLDERAGHPVVRVGGPKDPDLGAILALAPELVVASKEENRREDVEALRADGAPVWVTDAATVDGALVSMGRLFGRALGLGSPPDWLRRARRAWAGADGPVISSVVVCIWRDPWMVIGPRTFAAHVLRRTGRSGARTPDSSSCWTPRTPSRRTTGPSASPAATCGSCPSGRWSGTAPAWSTHATGSVRCWARGRHDGRRPARRQSATAAVSIARPWAS